MTKKWVGVVISGIILANCGGGGSSGGGGGTPSPTGPTPSPGPTGSTITITASGVSPNRVVITAGSRVTFVNNDSRPHDMSSDPHPEHTDCPEMNSVGFINPNQTKETGNFVTPRTCGFHDHNQPTTTSLQGTIVVGP